MEITKWDLFKRIEQIPEGKYPDIYEHLYQIMLENLADPYDLTYEEVECDIEIDDWPY